MPKITILPDEKIVEVPAGTSLLEASQKAGALHGSACGGVGACSTCHVYVREGLDSLSASEDRELDQLDQAFDVKPTSRLGCQAQVGSRDVVFEVTAESLKTWLDEHPDERKEIENGQMPAGVSAALATKLAAYVKR